MGNIPAESISEMTIQKYEDGGHSALVNGVVLKCALMEMFLSN